MPMRRITTSVVWPKLLDTLSAVHTDSSKAKSRKPRLFQKTEGSLVGNPARQIGWVSEYGHRLHPDANGHATCPESQQQYLLRNGAITRIA